MDGTTLENSEAGIFCGFLWLYVNGMTLAEAFALFIDPAKTGHIVFQYGEMEDVYDGFTNCTSVSIDVDGRVSVCMTKGE